MAFLWLLVIIKKGAPVFVGAPFCCAYVWGDYFEVAMIMHFGSTPVVDCFFASSAYFLKSALFLSFITLTVDNADGFNEVNSDTETSFPSSTNTASPER